MRIAINTISILGIQTAVRSAKLIVRNTIDSSAAYLRLSLRDVNLRLHAHLWRQLAMELAAEVGPTVRVVTPVTGGVCFAIAKQRPAQAIKRCAAAS